MHDDLFDFFYQAMPGYEQVGNRRSLLLNCWGSFQDPEGFNFAYKDMTKIPKWSNTIERDRARTYFQAYAAGCALHFLENPLEQAAGERDLAEWKSSEP